MGKFSVNTIKGKSSAKRPEQELNEKENEVRVGAGFFRNVNKKHVGGETIYLSRNQIDKNPNNFYNIGNIDSLAQSIKVSGLSQPLEVAKQQDGRYLLIGGERRLTAIDQLIAANDVPEWSDEMLISCVVKDPEEIALPLSSEKKEDFAIITTNKEAREYTDADRYTEIQKWKGIIEELRANGVEYISGQDSDGNGSDIRIKGKKTRDILSETTGMSSGQISKYEAVEKKGTQSLKDSLLNGDITISTAHKAASTLSEAEQNTLAADAKKSGVTPGDIGKYKRESRPPKQITTSVFLEDCEEILTCIKENKIVLDEKAQGKYDNYVRQLLNLLTKNQIGE